jgi:hypothetical protein
MPKIQFGKNQNNHERHSDSDAKDHDLRALHFQQSAAHPPPHLFKSRVMQPAIALAAARSHAFVFVSAIVARDIQSRPASFAFIPTPDI